MFRKTKDRPRVHITSKGARYVDANALFRRPRVVEILEKMKEFEKKSNATHETSEVSQTTTN